MSSCSSPELEPGPLADLDPAEFVGPPEPPVFEPLAKEFASHNAGWLTTLDSSIAVLEAESLVDVGSDVLSGIGAIASVHQSAVDPEALANLQAAQDGFRIARDKTAALQAGVPSDVQQPTFFTQLNFHVHDASGAAVAGALVQLDADFGNGSSRATDAHGNANFGVATSGSVSYTITRAGFITASGVVTLGTTVAHDVTLEAA